MSVLGRLDQSSLQNIASELAFLTASHFSPPVDRSITDAPKAGPERTVNDPRGQEVYLRGEIDKKQSKRPNRFICRTLRIMPQTQCTKAIWDNLEWFGGQAFRVKSQDCLSMYHMGLLADFFVKLLKVISTHMPLRLTWWQIFAGRLREADC